MVVIGLLGLPGVVWQWRAAVRPAACRGSRDARNAQAKEQAPSWRRGRPNSPSNVSETRGEAEEKKQTELAEQRLYDVRMNLVQRYWEDSNGELLQQGLDEQLPANTGGIDRRGFEWFYWQRKMSSGHITLKGHTDSRHERGVQPRRQRLASASRRWDGEGVGRRDRAGNPHPQGAYGRVSSVAFSPDGKRLASAG